MKKFRIIYELIVISIIYIGIAMIYIKVADIEPPEQQPPQTEFDSALMYRDIAINSENLEVNGFKYFMIIPDSDRPLRYLVDLSALQYEAVLIDGVKNLIWGTIDGRHFLYNYPPPLNTDQVYKIRSVKFKNR